MGVLDDAIREHLELKRQHGAEEDEIARKEAEALGPARRGPAPEADAAAEPADPAAAGDADPAGGSMADAAEALGEAPAADPLGEAPAADSVVEAPPAEPAAPSEPAAPPEPEAPVAETEPVPDGEDLLPPPVEPTIDVRGEVEPPGAIEPPADGGPPIHDVDRDPLEPPPPVPGATQEFDTLAARDDEPAAPAGEDEDVLEETPEFLRETPEHDRLWFEQKPPRDFDLEE